MNAIFQFFDMIGTRIAYPFLYSLLSLQSAYRRVQSIGQKPTFHWENTYADQPVALVALYQKGKPRLDTLALLRSLKANGCYVLVVNTLKLTSPDSLKDCCDCYVEKANFGRDFGSYKLGFQTFYERGWEKSCPRLLMINDSVFCVSNLIDDFVRRMLDPEFEVLGSTENYEIIHHLGSFCIAYSKPVLNHRRFREYWRDYKNSDVRTRVIRRGEQQLSKTLKKCASSPSEFRTLYGTNEFLRKLQESDDLIDEAILNARQSPLTGWKRFSAKKVIEDVRSKFLLRSTEFPESVTMRLNEALLDDRVVAHTLDGLMRIAGADLRDGEEPDPDLVRREVIAQLTDVYMSGSQIHQNASTLVRMGLPIVKLDGLYRGMFTIHDIQMITGRIPREDAVELQRLLLERPYGGDALRGWKRAAFMRGLI